MVKSLRVTGPKTSANTIEQSLPTGVHNKENASQLTRYTGCEQTNATK